MFATITAVPRVEAPVADLIAMETLFDAHHPAIGRYICLLSYNHVYTVMYTVDQRLILSL